MAKRLVVVEWFPYKSTRYKAGCLVRSQAYGFFLVSAAIQRGALIVISRRVAQWEQSVPELRLYRRTLTLSSPQYIGLTPNNMKHNAEKTAAAWTVLVDALR